jgi:hypothetical protein
MIPERRRATLIAQTAAGSTDPAHESNDAPYDADPAYFFTIRLQGPEETVFFDV